MPGYGSASQTGDFNGDGQRDLVHFQTSVAPGDDPMGTTGAVWYGPVSRAGTPASAVTLDNEDLNYFDVWDAVPGDVDHDGRTDLALITQNAAGIQGTAEAGDGFGSRVRLLDTDGDGHADLAASANGENDDTGAVRALHDQPTGIVPDGALVIGPVTLGHPRHRGILRLDAPLTSAPGVLGIDPPAARPPRPLLLGKW